MNLIGRLRSLQRAAKQHKIPIAGWIMGLLFLWIGLYMMPYVVEEYRDYESTMTTGIEVHGTIGDVQKGTDDRGNKEVTLTVTYSVAGVQHQRERTLSAGAFNRLKKRSPLLLRVDPNRPDHAILLGHDDKFVAWKILLGFMLFFLAVGLLVVVHIGLVFGRMRRAVHERPETRDETPSNVAHKPARE